MMGNRSARVATVSLGMVLASTLLLHCSGQTTQDAFGDGGPNAGQERGPCYGNNTCNAGLTCLSNVCVNAGTDAHVEPTVDGSAFPKDSGTLPDSGSDEDSGFVDSGGDDGGQPSTLYTRLGQHAGIAALVHDSFEGANGETDDPQILSYFYIRTAPLGTGAGGAPSIAVVEDCFTNFLAKAAGGPEPYPFTSHAGGANFVCRDMATAHAGLGITTAAFQKFVTILASKFVAAGVSSADLQSVGSALLGTAADIVDTARTNGQRDAGNDAAWQAANYGALCDSISGGAATAPGCVTP
jgi:hypothetical protein